MTISTLKRLLKEGCIVEEKDGVTQHNKPCKYNYYKKGKGNIICQFSSDSQIDDPYKINFRGKWYYSVALKGKLFVPFPPIAKKYKEPKEINIVGLI